MLRVGGASDDEFRSAFRFFPQGEEGAKVELSDDAARDLGTAFRFFRHARGETLRAVARKAGMSYQYAHNIETGVRTRVAEGQYHALGRAYGVANEDIANLILRAEITTALGRRGVHPKDIRAVWPGIVAALASVGYSVDVDLAKIVAGLLGPRIGPSSQDTESIRGGQGHSA